MKLREVNGKMELLIETRGGWIYASFTKLLNSLGIRFEGDA